jgi:hypothetical protein
MFVIVFLAFRGACVANAGTEFEHFAKDLFVRSRTAEAKARGRFTDVRAIAAGANALGHVHFLG